jgi:ribosome recycling factor
MTDDVLASCKQEMEQTIGAFRKELSHVRTGRANTALLDGIMVEYYGAKTPLNQVATLSVPDPTLLVVQPYDKSVAAAIEKAIRSSDLGLNPQSDGKLIRVPIPALNEERRRELVKHTRKLAEDYRVSVRNHRRDALEMLKELEKEHEIAEDDRRHGSEKIETLTKDAVERLEKTLKAKEDEIMAV